LTQYFSISADFPDEILLPQKIANAELLESWLQTKAGKRVKLLFPQKGEKAQLLGLAEKNAAAFAVQNKAKFENASEKTIGAANELARGLKIDRELKRIEAYDISHFSGDATAGALVVFERGEPKNSDYRHFKIRSLEKGAVDDCASLAEILSRRMEYLVPQNSAIKIRKASKKQLLEIEKILHTKIDPQKEEWFAAFCESRVAGGFRLVSHGQKRFAIDALFGEDLTEILLKFALRKNAGKLYFCGDSEIAARLGFREIKKIPEFLRGQKRVFVAEKSARADTSFAARPDLVLLDGGKGQLSAVLKNVKFPKGVAVVALAKKTEELFKMTNGKFERILLPRDSQALYLVQRVRDEAHRFANSLREKLQNPTKK
ncbi:MAG: hypothetical protein ABIE14_00390, partial [Patescibacteria group bacterium]